MARAKRLDGDRGSPLVNDTWRVFRIMVEFVEGFETLANIGAAVTVFGSARTKPEDPYYRAAEKTGALLAKSKFAVITGGGPGIMEAANRGAFETGGLSIGCNIALPNEQEATRYQQITLDFHYFYARKVMFVKYASAFICFPGGYGTLDEFFETLTLIQTLKIEPFPIILFGKSYWSGLVDWMKTTLEPGFIDENDLKIFKIVDTPEEAVRWLKTGVKKHWWQPRDKRLRELVKNGRGLGPLAGSKADTGEGTRYGRRPGRPNKEHVSEIGNAERKTKKGRLSGLN
jgi:uncharacterized protein (TIGR00730 family)